MGLVIAETTRPNSFVVRVRSPWASESGTYPICRASARIRFLVAAEISGASRKTFETVMTDTPARSAISFNRTIRSSFVSTREGRSVLEGVKVRAGFWPYVRFLNGRTAPVQLLPQRFKKGVAGQAHQSNGPLTAPNGDGVAGRELSLDLPIRGQDRFHALTEHF